MKFVRFVPFFLVLFAAGSAALAQTTTTWRAANNPHVINGTVTIPAGQTVVMEPGVVVQINANSKLLVQGTLQGAGTVTNHVRITGAAVATSLLEISGLGSTLNVQFTDIQAQTQPGDDSSLLFADCTFSGKGSIFNGAVLQMENTHAPYLQLDRCAFVGDTTYASASLYVAYCTVALRDTTFSNGSFCSIDPAYVLLDRVTSTNSAQFGIGLGPDADLFVNNVTVTNAAFEGLRLGGDTRQGTNALLGQNVSLTGNQYPVHLTWSGLRPGSTIPATGNRNNFIHASNLAGGGGIWPKFQIPYYVDGSPLNVGGTLHILPGVTVKIAPFAYIIDTAFGDGMRALGTKEALITFERADPTQAWYDLHADRTEGGRMRFCIVDGSSDGVNGGDWRLENLVIRNNGIGTSGGALVSGTQYLNNGTGHYANGGSLNGGSNPNTFEGNGVGVNYSPDATNVWWGSPTGPTTPRNPGGTGDSIQSDFTPFQPFLRTRPDYTDGPPLITFYRPSFQQHPGSKVTLRWEASDDGTIVSQKILFSAVGNFPGSFQTVATLPGDQRNYEWTVPTIGFQVAGANSYIKIVAIDNTGKESFDEWEIVVPTDTIQGTVAFNVSAGQTFRTGERTAQLFTANVEPYMSQVERYLEIVGGETRKTYSHTMPQLSTDTARFVISYGDTSNRRTYWRSEFFKIRPDSRIGDAPPTVTLTAPTAGQAFTPGGVVSITWTASDDEGLRGFEIAASFDHGRTWQPVARDLPGDARSYNWQTAPGTGYADVRVLVVAKDWRFQTSSDGANRSFALGAGDTAQPAVASLMLNPSSIGTGETSQGTVTLTTPAPSGGVLVTISNSGPTFVTAPANLTIPAGATTGTFAITTTNVAMTGDILISATAGGVTKTATLTVKWQLTGMSLPSSAAGGSTVNGSVTLNNPAPAGGKVVSLSSTNTGVATVPASVTVPEGAMTAPFVANTRSVSSATPVNISGALGGSTQIVTLNVTPPATNAAPTVSITSPSVTNMRIPAGVGLLLGSNVNDDGQPANGALTLQWTKVSGPGTVTFESPASGSTAATFSASGTYVLRLTVSDGALTTNADVSVRYGSTGGSSVGPSVNAGSDQTISNAASATLQGTASDNGTFATVWQKLSGPGAVTFTSVTSPATTAAFSASGTYVLRLIANDGTVATFDDVRITVTLPFDSWRTQNFTAAELANSAISGDLADADGDGISNLVEYKLGLSPKSADKLPAPVMENGRLTLTYTRAKAATDVALKVEVASAPGALSASSPSDVSETVLSEDAQRQTVKATDISSVATGATQRFMRLKVTRGNP